MTLTQLEAFALVARLGSVKAAAGVLGVSEPAVSRAIAALRQHLGDELVVRTTRGMELTPGGQRLVGIASQMVNLGADAYAAIRRAQGSPELLRIVATTTVAEYAAAPVVDTYTARTPGVETSLGVSGPTEMPVLLTDRLADVALGPRLTGPGLDCTPIMRHRLVVVAGPRHRLVQAAAAAPGAAVDGPANGRLGAAALIDTDWLVDPDGADPTSETGRLLARLRVPDRRVHVFNAAGAAWAAAADGHGVAPALERLVATELAEGRLVALPLPGTPADVLWYVTSLDPSRRSAAVSGLRQFLATPDAMHVMHRGDGSVPIARFRPPVHVTIWS